MGQALPAAGIADTMEWIEVSPEMTAVIGCGPIDAIPLPGDSVMLTFRFGGGGGNPAVHFGAVPDGEADQIVLVVARAAMLRLGGETPTNLSDEGYHLPTELRTIALAFRDCPMRGETRTVYRLAKSIELLCETLRMAQGDTLVPLAPADALSFADTRRLITARRMIDERWHEKLTLEMIARNCGINRAKLTRGFRDMFACTIAEAIAERRLGHASRMLLTTDKPVSSIGYENGYLNNASFARAFGRRFGLSPSDYRARVAA